MQLSVYRGYVIIFFFILCLHHTKIYALVPAASLAKTGVTLYASPSDNKIKALKEYETSKLKKIFSSLCTAFISPTLVSALDRPMDDPLYRKATFNVPSDDFWYPPYFIGKWNTTLTFENAVFTEKFTLDELAKDDNLPGMRDAYSVKQVLLRNDMLLTTICLLYATDPGFSKYSVIFAPDMGKDVNFVRRFAQIDSHPREDHPFNIRRLVSAFVPDVIDLHQPHNSRSQSWGA